MINKRNLYTECGLLSLRRLLTLQDRNPYSPTYGCLHRDYWLYKTSDFPDAVRQFGVHGLALAWKYDLPGNLFYRNEEVLAWANAGLAYWAGLQHSEGSFDEFYPNERGWVGPTAFTTYTSAESCRILGDALASEVRQRVFPVIEKAADFIAKGEAEEDHLANHHAMACLSLWKAYQLLNQERHRDAFQRAFETFLTYHNPEEGWSREYDGPDFGYLSATVSFFAKIYSDYPDAAIREVMDQSLEACSYFVYPDGHFAGTLGSRNTQHFYSHGFEIAARENKLAAAIARKLGEAIGRSQLVPPHTMSDRYVHYRVPEMLLTAIDAYDAEGDLPLLPCEGEDFQRHFEQGGCLAVKHGNRYMVVNLKKGGVTKVYDTRTGELLICDSGLIAETANGRIITSQETDPRLKVEVTEKNWTVIGNFKQVPSQKLFTVPKNLIFRSLMLILGIDSGACHWFKGVIRKILIFDKAISPYRFERICRWGERELSVTDTVSASGTAPVLKRMRKGGEFYVRYVPQSRFFQPHELESRSYELNKEDLEFLNSRAGMLNVEVVTKDGDPCSYRSWPVQESAH